MHAFLEKEEKQFLGYEFSNKRGSEGIHPIQRGKSIDECTCLFANIDNPEKANYYIKKAFTENNFNLEIPDSLQKNISHQNLIDLLTFDRIDFDKSISLSIKIKIESIWKTGNLKYLAEISEVKKGKTITEIKTVKGIIPVIAGEKKPTYFHNEANRKGNVITVSASGANAGFINYFKTPIFASDCNTIISKNEDKFSTKLIFYFLKSIQKEIYYLQKGQAQPHVYADDLLKIKIPFPSKEIQEIIISEIKILEEQENKAKEKTKIPNSEAVRLFENYSTKNNKVFRLSNTNIFEVSIGKRLLKREILEEGEVPVFSANVF